LTPLTFHRDSETFEVDERLPVLPLRDLVVFPHVVIPLLVGRAASLAAVDAVSESRFILLVAQRTPEVQDPASADLYRVGVIARILQVVRQSSGATKVLVEGIARARVTRYAPSAEMLRVRIGEGLTGWVAAHNEPVRLGDAAAYKRRLTVGPDAGPESILLVPMAADEHTVGVIVLSKIGRDRFTADHETTLTIFAGHAAQALLSVERHELLVRQQGELEQRLASQRRLLAVNEQLVSTLDPTEVLGLIADSLKAVVAYDTLGIYVIDRVRGARRAVVARDRFAEAILTHES